MYKIVLLSIALLISAGQAFAQDILVMTDGTEKQVKVTEIDRDDILYLRNGVVSRVHSSKVFMIIYKDGTRETMKAPAGGAMVPVSDNQPAAGFNPTGYSQNNGLFVARLENYEGHHDPKMKGYMVNAVVEVHYAGRPFSKLLVSSYQRGDKDFDYSKPNARYWRNNWVTVSAQSEQISHILYEKYENVNGKGFGWGIPPDFFSGNAGICTVAYIDQNPANKEVVGFGGMSHIKMKIADCSSPEQKLLSVVMLWLDANFGKSGKI